MSKLSKLSRSVEGKVAIVTGAASGMGKATAYVFADERARVAVVDVTDVSEVVNDINNAGGEAKGWQLDVADGDAIIRVIDEIAAHFGGIDIVINNAGISAGLPIDDDGYEALWHRAFDILITAHMRIVRAALPYLRESEAARIVNIASTEGLGATRGASPYTAAKTAVIGFTRALSVELGPENITVNCICPGPIRTGMTQQIPDEAKAKFARRRVALNRYADPEEVAQMTVSLCLPAACFLTGTAIPVDGGLTIRNA